MKRIIFSLPLLAASLVFAMPGTSPFAAWAEKVAGLKTVKADISVQEIGQGTSKFKISMKKPSSLRVESDTELVVADGKTISVLDKQKNIFYTRPQSDAEVQAVLTPDQYALFRTFFDAKAYDGLAAKAGESRTLGGETVRPIDVAFDAKGKKMMTIYVGADGLARKAERRLDTANGKKSAILSASGVLVNTELPADEFAFKAPESATEVQYADLISTRWFTDLQEAEKVAAASGKKIFVDFFATWCGPCKILEREVFTTDEFKALGKKFVFLRIDVDAQPGVAQAYNIEAMPTQAVLKADGTEEGRTVGYGGPAAFFDFINRY